jgi:hypothetical protein
MNVVRGRGENAEGFIIASRGRGANLLASEGRRRERGHLESFSQFCWYSRTVVGEPGCQRLMHSTMDLAWLQ